MQQGLLALILLAMMAAFAWGRWRFDVVAVSGLLAATVAGLVSPEGAFAGFGSQAVITVAAVLVLTRSLAASGAVDRVSAGLLRHAGNGDSRLALLCAMAASLSAFMNNVGALALVMPVALGTARRNGEPPGRYLLALSYATLLGGMVTLIGTPPNMLIAHFRAEATGTPFSFLAFTAVGLPLAVLGVAYLIIRARHRPPATPVNDNQDIAPPVPVAQVLFDIELVVTGQSPLIGRRAAVLADYGDIALHGIVRNGAIQASPPQADDNLMAGDTLILRADAATLAVVTRDGGLAPRFQADDPAAVLAEVVVAPNALIQGSCAASLELHERYGVILVGAARPGQRLDGRLADLPLSMGDILLLHGTPEAIAGAIDDLGCLPLVDRGLSLRHPTSPVAAVAVFALAALAAATELVEPGLAFVGGILGLLATRAARPADIYRAIDWPVIVLLGAMIPLGGALHSTGLAASLGDLIIGLTGPGAGAFPIIVVTLAATMALTPFLNNPATVAVMAPIALELAGALNLPPDPLLMAVAVGASCDFLTPFGHHNNALVMAAGGYKFTDFARLGWGLEVLVLTVGSGLIWLVWR